MSIEVRTEGIGGKCLPIKINDDPQSEKKAEIDPATCIPGDIFKKIIFSKLNLYTR